MVYFTYTLLANRKIMEMDVDYVAGIQAIIELEKLFSDQGHGERKEISDDIIEFVEKMKVKYGDE